MHKWHEKEENGLYIPLMLFRLIPHFFAPLPEDTVPKLIDIAPSFKCGDMLTTAVDKRDQVSTPAEYAKVWNLAWMQGGATKLLYTCVYSSIGSMSCKEPPSTGLLSTWCVFYSAVALYTNCVLGISNVGQPVEPRLTDRMLSILDRDLSQRKADLQSSNPLPSDLWFWKAIVGAFSVAFMDRAVPQPSTELPMLGVCFERHIREWAGSHRDGSWVTARRTLGRIIWPLSPLRETLAELSWSRAMAVL